MKIILRNVKSRYAAALGKKYFSSLYSRQRQDLYFSLPNSHITSAVPAVHRSPHMNYEKYACEG